MKKAVCFALAAAMLLCLAACGKSEQRSKDEIISDIIVYYGCYMEKADKIEEKLFRELERISASDAGYMRQVMDYWRYVDNELTVNMGELPEGLENTDKLCIAVLGFELNDDGTMQPELIGRLETALTAANQYPDAVVVCTGGGTARNNSSVTEAGLMAEWLTAHGLDESRLIIEDKSLTTVQNAELSYALLQEKHPEVDSVAIVSSSYHIGWGSLLFEAVFTRTATENPTAAQMHVVTNAAYETYNEKYSDTHRFMTGALIDMLIDHNAAMQIYMNGIEPPEL